MEDLIKNLRNVEGVKSVKVQTGPVLKIDLFSKPILGSEVVEIRGDLRKISQKIRSRIDKASKKGEFKGWEWIVKPEKKYQETSLGTDKVSDRKSKGHKPGYYRVSIQK